MSGQFPAGRGFPVSQHQELCLPNHIRLSTKAETSFCHLNIFSGKGRPKKKKTKIIVTDNIIYAIVDFVWKHSTSSQKTVKVVKKKKKKDKAKVKRSLGI